MNVKNRIYLLTFYIRFGHMIQQKYRVIYWSLRKVKSFIVLQCAAFEHVTRSALDFLKFVVVFYNKQLTVTVCILTVFKYIYKGCTPLNLTIWDFLLTVRARAGMFWCWQKRRGRSTTEDVLNQPLTLTLKFTCLKIRNSSCLSRNYEFSRIPIQTI